MTIDFNFTILVCSHFHQPYNDEMKTNSYIIFVIFNSELYFFKCYANKKRFLLLTFLSRVWLYNCNFEFLLLIFYFNSSYCLAFSGVSGVCLDCCNPGIALLFLFFCCCCCFLLSFSSCLKFISSCSCMFLPPSHLSVSVYCSARVFLTLFLVTAFWLFPDFSCVLFHFLLPVCPIVSLVLITHGPIPSFF